MLKPEELRIGNLVQALDGKIVMITHVNNKDAVITDYNPVQFTIKWTAVFERQLRRHGIEIQGGGHVYSFKWNGVFIRSFHYVHQLQNIFYALYDFELTFKPVDNGVLRLLKN